jgi:hypothetical protein
MLRDDRSFRLERNTTAVNGLLVWLDLLSPETSLPVVFEWTSLLSNVVQHARIMYDGQSPYLLSSLTSKRIQADVPILPSSFSSGPSGPHNFTSLPGSSHVTHYKPLELIVKYKGDQPIVERNSVVVTAYVQVFQGAW